MKQASALAQAESLLLAPFDLQEGDLARTFGNILSHRVDYADLYFQYSRSEAWSLDEGIVKSGSFNIDQGVGVRALSGEKTAFAYSDDISARALDDAAGGHLAAIERRDHALVLAILVRIRGDLLHQLGRLIFFTLGVFQPGQFNQRLNLIMRCGRGNGFQLRQEFVRSLFISRKDKRDRRQAAT